MADQGRPADGDPADGVAAAAAAAACAAAVPAACDWLSVAAAAAAAACVGGGVWRAAGESWGGAAGAAGGVLWAGWRRGVGAQTVGAGAEDTDSACMHVQKPPQWRAHEWAWTTGWGPLGVVWMGMLLVLLLQLVLWVLPVPLLQLQVWWVLQLVLWLAGEVRWWMVGAAWGTAVERVFRLCGVVPRSGMGRTGPQRPGTAAVRQPCAHIHTQMDMGSVPCICCVAESNTHWEDALMLCKEYEHQSERTGPAAAG